MIHAIIVRDPVVFKLVREQVEAKKIPLSHLSYEVYAQGNIRLVGGYDVPMGQLIQSVNEEFNPDLLFFFSESAPVSDEKRGGDIVLPNVLFLYNPAIEEGEIEKERFDSLLSTPVFLEHYPVQGDYNFETFGLSVGGVHVSGKWNMDLEDFRIRLRMVYENDTFDPDLYSFVETAKNLSLLEKSYPVAYVATEDSSTDAKNLWSIVMFIIGSIDPDLIPEEETMIEDEREEEWMDDEKEER